MFVSVCVRVSVVMQNRCAQMVLVHQRNIFLLCNYFQHDCIHRKNMCIHKYTYSHVHTHVLAQSHTQTHAHTHIHTRTVTYANIYEHAHTHTHARTHTHTHARTHARTHTRTHTHTHTRTRALTHTQFCKFSCFVTDALDSCLTPTVPEKK